MDLLIEKETVWAASIQDQPGGLAALADAGADLEFVIARRAPEKPGTGVVFVTPLRSDGEVEAASAVGFNATTHMHSLRVAGPNESGIGAKLTRKLADAGLNMRGLSAAVIGTQFVMHLAFDTEADVAKATEVLGGA